ncbi:MAG TPA: hypothetical protein VF359_06585 [Anaerolineales bacterium]
MGKQLFHCPRRGTGSPASRGDRLPISAGFTADPEEVQCLAENLNGRSYTVLTFVWAVTGRDCANLAHPICQMPAEATGCVHARKRARLGTSVTKTN